MTAFDIAGLIFAAIIGAPVVVLLIWAYVLCIYLTVHDVQFWLWRRRNSHGSSLSLAHYAERLAVMKPATPKDHQ